MEERDDDPKDYPYDVETLLLPLAAILYDRVRINIVMLVMKQQ
jgi:hypothetical protein